MARSILWCGLATTLTAAACQQQDFPAAYSGPDVPIAPETRLDFAAQWRHAKLFQSGTRLRAQLLEGAPDAVAFMGFWDQQLDIGCSYGVAEDNVARCLPDSRSDVYFLDPECEHAVWLGTATADGCAAPSARFGRVTLPNNAECADAPRTAIYTIGASRPAAALYWLGSDGSCQAASEGSCLREVTELSADNFVAAHCELEQTDDALAIRWGIFDDGGRTVLSAHDTQRAVDCGLDPRIAADRCVPSRQADVFLEGGEGGDVSRSTCSAGYVATDYTRDACSPAAVGVVWRRRACETYKLFLFELGSACTAANSASGTVSYALGEAFDLTTLPSLLSLHGGRQRLQLTYTANTQGKPLQSSQSFYDSLLLRECEPQRFADASLRCVPKGSAVEIGRVGPFADAQCQTPLVSTQIATTSCGSAPPTLAVLRTPQRDYPESYHAIGVPWTSADGSAWYLYDGKCGRSVPQPMTSYYLVGPALALATLSERIE